MVEGIQKEVMAMTATFAGDARIKMQYLNNQLEAWKVLFEITELDDDDVKLILASDKSQKADHAREIILKIFTMDTFLPHAIEQA